MRLLSYGHGNLYLRVTFCSFRTFSMPAPNSQQDAIQAFIDLANDMKNEGATIQFVSTALMRACAVYSTYVVAGNEGALRKSGVEKLKNLLTLAASSWPLPKLSWFILVYRCSLWILHE